MTGRRESHTRKLVGKRRDPKELTPENVLQEARIAQEQLNSEGALSIQDWKELTEKLASACRAYYTLAAVSRRRNIEPAAQEALFSELFQFRASIEKRIFDSLLLVGDQELLWKDATSNSFFGVSAKQGVSIRYPLATCVPTKICGARCYAHDGRDRELHPLFRGALTHYVGFRYEEGSALDRKRVFESLDKAISYGVSAAIKDASNAKKAGYNRLPRVRFSHVGEMAATPEFTNDLANELKKRCPELACVIYSRHPNANRLNTEKLVVNFTLDRHSSKRRKHAPDGSRIVYSSWDGELSDTAEVNFLEHHVTEVKSPNLLGNICPVTENHQSIASCDEAHCDKCFRAC